MYFITFKNFLNFSGRSTRTEYWSFFAINTVIGIIISIIDAQLNNDPQILSIIFRCLIILPGLAVAVRRMHDTNHNGWWLLFPIVNLLYLIRGSDAIDNSYGPKHSTSTKSASKKADEFYVETIFLKEEPQIKNESAMDTIVDKDQTVQKPSSIGEFQLFIFIGFVMLFGVLVVIFAINSGNSGNSTLQTEKGSIQNNSKSINSDRNSADVGKLIANSIKISISSKNCGNDFSPRNSLIYKNNSVYKVEYIVFRVIGSIKGHSSEYSVCRQNLNDYCFTDFILEPNAEIEGDCFTLEQPVNWNQYHTKVILINYRDSNGTMHCWDDGSLAFGCKKN